MTMNLFPAYGSGEEPMMPTPYDRGFSNGWITGSLALAPLYVVLDLLMHGWIWRMAVASDLPAWLAEVLR